jgi:hypothetical protein
MKLYFSNLNDGLCCCLKDHKQFMIENDIKEMEVFEAKIEYGNGLFYCSKIDEVGGVGNGCGEFFCDKYSPRNGKNGRCRFSGHTYEQTEIKKTIKLK